MNIAIIDADLVGRRQHRFPNLACMKLSGYYKDKGYNVELKLDYSVLQAYDKVFISKVFTDTPVPEEVLSMPNVEWIEKERPVVTCANCDVWKKVSYLDGYGICQRTTSLEYKKHFCSAGQHSLTVEEET